MSNVPRIGVIAPTKKDKATKVDQYKQWGYKIRSAQEERKSAKNSKRDIKRLVKKTPSFLRSTLKNLKSASAFMNADQVNKIGGKRTRRRRRKRRTKRST
jgi:hypothetical protein